MILVSLSGCYGILHQINLILNLVVVFHFFPVFLLCKKNSSIQNITNRIKDLYFEILQSRALLKVWTWKLTLFKLERQYIQSS